MSKAFYRQLTTRGLVLFVIFLTSIMISTKSRADDLQYLGESAEAFMRITDEVDHAQSIVGYHKGLHEKSDRPSPGRGPSSSSVGRQPN